MNVKTNSIFDLSHFVSFVSALVLIVVWRQEELSPMAAGVTLLVLANSIMLAVHYAELISIKVGASLGALVLALSVTVIEVGLVVSLMGRDSPDALVVARDTVFAAVIIVTNGIMGVCLLLAGIRQREVGFHAGGASSLLAVLAVLSCITLVLPNFTTSSIDGTYSTSQLLLISVSCVLLYLGLVVSQTIFHKDYYSPFAGAVSEPVILEHQIPSRLQTCVHFLGLVLNLLVVVGLAKALGPSIEMGIEYMGSPRAVVGIVIALLVLMPETWTAISSARSNQLQTSLNLALGSGAASIALTVPVVSIYSIYHGKTLVLGLGEKGMVFLLMTFLLGGLTLGGGRTTALMGVVHLVLLFTFLTLNFIP